MTGPLERLRRGYAGAAVVAAPDKQQPADRAFAAAGLAVVADGVGLSAQAGPAAEAVVAGIVTRLGDSHGADPETVAVALQEALAVAADDIDASPPGWSGKTTVTVAAIASDRGSPVAVLCWVGDSPAATVSPDGRWRWHTTPDAALTNDFTVGGETPPESGNKIDQAVGGRPFTPNLLTVELGPDDVVVVASDGLLSAGTDPSRLLGDGQAVTADALALAAHGRGATDDVAVAVLHPGHRVPLSVQRPARGWRRFLRRA